jgi:hypothetical protein
MNSSQGVKVFNSSTNCPTILAYKKTGIFFLTLICRSDHYYIKKISFSHLLDVIPIHSITLPIDLPLFDSIVDTIRVWIELIEESLKNYDPFKTITVKKKRKEKIRLPPINYDQDTKNY